MDKIGLFAFIIAFMALGLSVSDGDLVESGGGKTAPIYSSGLSFDGVNDWVGLTEPPSSPTNLNNGSVFAWIKTSGSGGGFHGIVIKQNSYGMFLYNDVLIIYDWGNGQIRSSGKNLADNNYHFIGFTFTNINDASPVNNSELWVDGSSKGIFTLKKANDNEGLTIGSGDNPGTTQFYNGFMDEIRIYNRVLSNQEILNLYNGFYVNRTGLIVEYLMNEELGASIYDSSDNDNTGAIYGATWANYLISKNYSETYINSTGKIKKK